MPLPKDVQPSFHAGVPVLLENWLFLSGYHGPRPVVGPVVPVPDAHDIQNGIGHVGITDNVPGAWVQAFDVRYELHWNMH
ncbi:MAG: hypothetical protein HF976_02640 [ANME-2 cluster archaeon]|nr:hypothetical protein [ANME-2 cluster archaeon]MBC2700303.1 hypothetical protein [ANME-2 cluster archaeon]MBC2706133.1 hypothetical protein [ANME-2 cluster archaeon]MBC2748405.1 hypothetical protein [ANME-2 cluster archaeon]